MPVLPTVAEGDSGNIAAHNVLVGLNNTWNGTTVYTPASFAATAHNQAASTITSGVLSPARLGTGTPTSSNFLRGDGTWAAPVAPPTGFEGYAPGDFALVSHTHGVNDLTATGTKSATTFLRGDNTWATPAQAVVLVPMPPFFIDGTAVAGTQKPRMRTRGTWTIKEVSVDANTAPTGTGATFDVLLNSVSIWTTPQRLTLAAGSSTNSTTTFTTSAVPDNGLFQLQVISPGGSGGIAAADVTIMIWLQLVTP